MASEANVSPAVLEWARNSAGFSIEEAADKVGVRPRRVIEWEEGVRMPTMPQARAAAHVYGRPLALLFSAAVPQDPATPPDFRPAAGGEPPTVTPELRQEVRVAQARRETAIELDPVARQPISELIGSLTIDSDAEASAIRIRPLLLVTWAAQLGWRDNYAALNAWRAALESLGILVFRFSGVPTAVVRGFSLSGSTYPVVALNSTDAPTGRAFTLMHELGHLLVGTGGICDLDDREHAASRQTIAAERFCNRFAAAVLMPRESLLGLPLVAQAHRESAWSLGQLRELASTIHVSQHALLVRLKEIGRTNEANYQRTLTEILSAGNVTSPGGFELPAEGAIREVGVPFARLVLSAYQNEAITARDLAEYLGVRFKHIQRIQDLLEPTRA